MIQAAAPGIQDMDPERQEALMEDSFIFGEPSEYFSENLDVEELEDWVRIRGED